MCLPQCGLRGIGPRTTSKACTYLIYRQNGKTAAYLFLTYIRRIDGERVGKERGQNHSVAVAFANTSGDL